MKLNYFKIVTAFIDVRLKYFISAPGNLPEIISKLLQRFNGAYE